MSKVVVVYWSGTGNTEIMAKAIAEGACAEYFSVSDFNGSIDDYDKIALGCPSMGDEELEENEFEPFFESIENKLKGKKVALFGSYSWGDGDWMRNWEERVKKTDTVLFNEGLVINETPDENGIADCKKFGESFMRFI